jgi:ABC-type lipoprotein release transport system permease subunit
LELLLGEALARRLSVRAGDTVVLITAAGNAAASDLSAGARCGDLPQWVDTV